MGENKAEDYTGSAQSTAGVKHTLVALGGGGGGSLVKTHTQFLIP